MTNADKTPFAPDVGKLTSPAAIRQILSEHGVQLKKSLGQHFLADANVLTRIVETILPVREKSVLEIGAGIGTLTVALAPHVGQLWAVEIDPRLIPILRANTQPFPNVHVVFGDFLDLELRSFAENILLVGNLPYSITSDVALKLVRERDNVARAVFTVQWEVGEKFAAPPGPKASRLGVFLRTYFEVQIVRRIPKTVFFPPPEVDGALLHLKTLPTPRVSLPEPLWENTLALVFAQRRKSLRSLLCSHLPSATVEALLSDLGLDGLVRAESLDFPELERLGMALAQLGLFQKKGKV